MDNKANKKAIKKREIIKSSIDVMFDNGYHGTGVKDLADAAGIPKGSLYNYFENKEDYLKEALIYYYEESSKLQFDILNDNKLSPIERIKEFYKYLIEDLNNECNYNKGCFLGKITQEVSGSIDLIQEITNDIQNEIIKSIKINLVEAVQNGDISSNKDIDALAEFIYMSWQGALLRVKASRSKHTLNNFYKILVEVLLK